MRMIEHHSGALLPRDMKRLSGYCLAGKTPTSIILISAAEALGWDAVRGHEEVVKLLLEWESMSPDTLGKHNCTPLPYAARGGMEEPRTCHKPRSLESADAQQLYQL